MFQSCSEQVLVFEERGFKDESDTNLRRQMDNTHKQQLRPPDSAFET